MTPDDVVRNFDELFGGGGSVQYEKIHLRVDDATIAAGDLSQIIRPVACTANIYERPAEYERSLRRFSHAQRLVFALQWYDAEVNNGGHDQFYSNSAHSGSPTSCNNPQTGWAARPL